MNPPPPSPPPSGWKGGCFKRLRGRSRFYLLSFSTAWRWKRVSLSLRISLLHDLAFRVLYVLEAVVLIAIVCLFYLFCGCHV
ncbi:hypothetical protein HPP92_024568 [Vanilla planifolia]|uniref:Transmembrane protein n=1 Tax=Vanilla planifolia TaxID=51239 RepID=A0A835UDE0_VANPL|nr:hypothetical protein HPP92_024568 [Vanilla planifolia]